MYAGRLTESKGVLDIVSAIAQLRAAGDAEITVTFAGGGIPEEFAAIRDAARELDIEERVILVGHLTPEQLTDLYRQSDVFVFPSYFAEGFPRVLYEAMMFSIPIVTTRMPGLDGFLVDGENCLYCEAQNPSDVAAKVADLLDHPQKAARIGMAANADVRRVFDGFEHGSHAEQLVHFAA
jgi:glycosyltransferase involved in cell wall biosynthesis